MADGYLNLVLHAHLPFVRHPEHEDFLEEDWLFEAITETYIPIIAMMNRLVDDGVSFKLTMTISPPLAEMLVDPVLQSRYLRHINKLVELSQKEITRTSGTPHLEESAKMYHEHFSQARDLFENKYNRNLVSAFKQLQEKGVLEIITCTATHGYLPLIYNRQARLAQIRVAVSNYKKHFGKAPEGIWLAECGYQPGDDQLLAESGLSFFFIETHGVLYGKPRPWSGIFAPVRCPSGVVAFPRDPQASEEVWSAQRGYPGDYYYREFYRDLGYDAEYEYIKPYLHTDGVRRNIGIKYYRITGPVELGQKEYYIPRMGIEKAAAHADDFIKKRIHEIHETKNLINKPPLITTPFDAELFGHWWFEGPMFLEFLIRKLAFDQETIELINAKDYLQEHTDVQRQQPSMSSWGAEGYSRIWLNGGNDWIYRHQHMAEERMVEIARSHPNASGLLKRYLDQAARELLLAQSSDWAFIMTTGTTVPYAVKRFKNHIHRFNFLFADIRSGNLNEAKLKEIEDKDTIFQEIDYRVYL